MVHLKDYKQDSKNANYGDRGYEFNAESQMKLKTSSARMEVHVVLGH